MSEQPARVFVEYNGLRLQLAKEERQSLVHDFRKDEYRLNYQLALWPPAELPTALVRQRLLECGHVLRGLKLWNGYMDIAPYLGLLRVVSQCHCNVTGYSVDWGFWAVELTGLQVTREELRELAGRAR